MANKNPPAHDFAPAWLKIPTYNSFKPSGASSEHGGHTSRRDEHSFGFTRHNKESDSLAYHSYFNDCRKERDDFDDSHSSVNNVHYYGMDNGFNGSSCNNQAILSRRPHSRHDFRISLSYAKSENNKHMTKNGSGYYGHKGKGKLHDNSSVSNNGVAEGRGIGVTSNNFNQEFPSLQGDISEEPTTPPALNESAWVFPNRDPGTVIENSKKPRTIKIQNPGIGKKIQLVKKPVRNENSCESSRKSPASSSSGPLAKSSSSISSITNPHTVIVTPVAKGGSNCRALIPAKPTATKKTMKEPLKLTNKKPNSTPSISTHSMEILVKHPKAPGNKSDFLKALRNETKEREEVEREEAEKNVSTKNNVSSQSSSEEPHVNGIDIAKLSCNDDREKTILSSSLEAEERLLREMGWKGEVSDDENYAPLTEDELKEFRDRSEKILKNNGIRRNLLSNSSPLRLAPFPTVPPPTENSTSSSSESDSDDP